MFQEGESAGAGYGRHQFYNQNLSLIVVHDLNVSFGLKVRYATNYIRLLSKIFVCCCTCYPYWTTSIVLQQFPQSLPPRV